MRHVQHAQDAQGWDLPYLEGQNTPHEGIMYRDLTYGGTICRRSSKEVFEVLNIPKCADMYIGTPNMATQMHQTAHDFFGLYIISINSIIW